MGAGAAALVGLELVQAPACRAQPQTLTPRERQGGPAALGVPPDDKTLWQGVDPTRTKRVSRSSASE